MRRLAVIGPTADNLPVLLANYNGTPSHPVTLLDGVRAAAAARGVSVAYARVAAVDNFGRRHRERLSRWRATATW